VQVGAPERGWRPLGRFAIQPGETFELGELRFVSPRFLLRAPDEVRLALAATFASPASGALVRSQPFQNALPIALPLDGDTWRLDARIAPLSGDANGSGELPFSAPRALEFDAAAKHELVIEPAKPANAR
jgi:hypothetical protein